MLYAFREYARFQRSYRELKRQGREHRKQILLDKLQLAARASQRKDTRALHQVIRQISPKLIAGKVRIRSTDGQLLTPQEEHSEILIYFQALFGTSSQEVTSPARLDPVILEQEEVEASLAQLGSGKAVPAHSAPSSAWKYCRQVLSGPLLEAFQSETIAGYPDLWANCCLKLTPKPQKVIKRPESLRPLGIQDAAGKTISRILKERLFAQISGLLERYPQFAYLCNRSTSDAIKRVEEHCRLIRSRIAADRVTLHQRKSGKRRHRYQGGAQLALDMTTAFDKLPRQSLADALIWAGVDDNLRSLILDVHEACCYRIEHEGFVSYACGYANWRQGCTLAPLLWALFSVYLLHCIEGKLQSEWPRQAMTLYADDTHCAWELNTLADLQVLQRSHLRCVPGTRHGCQ